MNKLKTDNNGGFPLELDDLRFEQLAIKEAIEGHLSPFGMLASQGCILSGCGITEDAFSYTVAEGFILISGEVYKVPAHSLIKFTGTPGVNFAYYWNVVTSYDPAGSETFENSVQVDTYEIRRVFLTFSDTPPASYMPKNAPTFGDKIKDMAGPSWTDYNIPVGKLGVAGGASGVSMPVASKFRYLRQGKTIHFQINISISYSTGTASAISVTLDEVFSGINTTIGFLGVGRFTLVYPPEFCSVEISPNSNIMVFSSNMFGTAATNLQLCCQGSFDVQ